MWNGEFPPKTCRISVQEIRTPDTHFWIRSSIVERYVFGNWVFGLGLEELFSAAEFDAAIAVFLQIHGSH